jgi:myo-inositol 2-dehydrogenase/D-chiro-inositol 1-dehydrogenase
MQYAIIGCGTIGRAHARATSGDQRIQQHYFVDLELGRAQALADEFGGLAVNHIDALPDNLDGASVTTAPGVHYAITRALLERSVAVFCEKPLAMVEAEAAELVWTARRRNIPLMVGFKMRYDPIFRRASEMIGRAGNLLAVSTTKVQPISGNPEKRQWLERVGTMYELSVHELDLVTAITGLQPQRVLHASLSFRKGWEREDGFCMTVDWGAGVVGSHIANFSEGIGFKFRDTVLTFIGDQGYVRVERPDRIVVHTDEVEVIEVNETVDAFKAELADFVSLVVDGHQPRLLSADGSEGFVTTSLVEAAFRAGGGGSHSGAKSRRSTTMEISGEALPTLDQFSTSNGAIK